MKTFFRHAFFAAIPLLATVLSASGQTEPSSESKQSSDSEQPSLINSTFRVLYWWQSNSSWQPPPGYEGKANPNVEVPEPETFYFRSRRDKWQEVTSRPDDETRPYDYRGPRKLVFYDRPGPVKEGEEPPEPIGSVTLPRGSSEVILLMSPSGRRLEFIPVNISPDRVRKGTIHVSNLSEWPTAFDMTGSRKIVPANEEAGLPFKPDELNQVKLVGAFASEEEWEVFYSTQIAARENSRILLIIHPKETSQEPEVKMIRLRF